MAKVVFRFKEDTPKPVKCEIIGEIPDWLSGSLYRNGAGLYQFGEDKYNHFFDGMAVVHKWVFDRGVVTHQNKLIETKTLKANMAAQRIVVSGLCTKALPDPCKNIFHRYFSYYFRKEEENDNTNINVMFVRDSLYAMGESYKISKINPEDLSHEGEVSLATDLLVVHHTTAHPHTEPDGTVYTLADNYSGSKGSHSILRIPPPKPGAGLMDEAKMVGGIPFRWRMTPSYNHSFPMSENYFVFIEQALTMDLWKIFLMKFGKRDFLKAFVFHPNEKNLFHVMSKSSGEVSSVKYTTDAFFYFHQINCYEDADFIIIDLCGSKDSSLMTEQGIITTMAETEVYTPVNVYRIVLPLNINQDTKVGENLVTLSDTEARAVLTPEGTVHCTPEIITEATLELPQINYKRYNGKKYKYCYGVAVQNPQETNKINKINVQTKQVISWCDAMEYLTAEPVFVSRPEATEEDDGVLLVPSISQNENDPSSLVVLDAKTMTEIGRANVQPDVRVPYTFHGIFKDNIQL